jgi:hypothetical protein
MDPTPSLGWSAVLRNRHIEQLADLPDDYEPLAEQGPPGPEGTDMMELLFKQIKDWIDQARPQLQASQEKRKSSALNTSTRRS